MPNLAIVFDFDGVILDTETPLYSSWQEMYARHGVRLDLELFATYIGGADYFDFHKHLQEQTGLTFDRQSLMDERRALYREHVSGNTVLPGVKAYLREARCLGYGIGLASNSDIGWVGSNLARPGSGRQLRRPQDKGRRGERKTRPRDISRGSARSEDQAGPRDRDRGLSQRGCCRQGRWTLHRSRTESHNHPSQPGQSRPDFGELGIDVIQRIGKAGVSPDIAIGLIMNST